MIEWFNQHWDGKCQHPTHVWFKLFFFLCVCECVRNHPNMQQGNPCFSMIFPYSWSQCSGLKHHGLGKSAKRADDPCWLRVDSEPPISFFFSIFFGWQWGYHKVKMARESSLKEGPTDFPHVISVTRWIHQGLRAPRWGESDKWFSKPLDIISS